MPMADYSFSQLEGLWTRAGGPKAVAPIAAAVALAESSGNPQAVNRDDPNGAGGTQTSWGLWQISNGTHGEPVADILNPQVNARQAVAKWRGAGDSFKPWGTYVTGKYLSFLPGGASAANAATASTASSGGSSGGASSQPTQVQLDSFNPGELTGILGGPFGIIQAAAQAAGKAIASTIESPGSLAQSVATFAKDFNALASLANALATDLLWLFKPGHWVRIAAFWFGILFLLPGVWMMSKAGQGEGDISLALGILLTMVAGVLLFIAFHNLPDDVTNLSELLGWLSSEIRSSSPAVTA